MPRPCVCGKCHLCHLADTDARYRRLWGLDPAPPAAPPEREPDACVHRGDDLLPVGAATAVGLPHPWRSWYACNHPGRPLPTTEVRDGKGYVCPCQGCGPKCPGYNQELSPAPATPGHVLFHMDAGGLGDAVLGLLAVTAFRTENAGVRVSYRVGRGAGRAFAALFEGYDELLDHGDPAPAGAAEVQLNAGYVGELNTKCREPRVLRYCRNAGVVGGPRLPALRDHGRVLAAGAKYRGVVAICPFSRGSDREYAVPGWLDVERHLAAAGYRTVVLHDDPAACWLFASEKVCRVPPEATAGVLLNAAAVLGIDSGLTHLAAAVGTPTVVLEGSTNVRGVFGAGYPRVGVVRGSFSCSGCHWNGPWTFDDCRPRCPSLQGVDPKAVADAAAACLLPAADRHRSVMSVDKLTTVREAARAAAGLPGDMAELGVYKGGSAAVILKGAGGGRLHLFDTFSGLPADDPDGPHRAGEFAAGLADVLTYLAGHDVVPHPGVFPAVSLPDTRYRFVHLDGDLYQTTRNAIAYFGPRMVRGGAILFDDYEWPHTPGVTRAVNEAFPTVERLSPYQALVKF